MDIARISRDDPHGLQYCVPAAFAVYATAKASYPLLRKKVVGIDEVKASLCGLAPGGPYERKGHARLIFKLINPSGHGANGARFQNPTLSWFRKQHPDDAQLTDGLALFICACIWWVEAEGERSVHHNQRPLITSDFDSKLKSLGFMDGERETLCRILRYNPRPKKRH